MFSFSGHNTDIEKDDETKEETNGFKKVFFGASTSALARHLFGFLTPKDRTLLAQTCIDTYRFEKVDKALTRLEFRIKFMEEILQGLDTFDYQDNVNIWRNPSGFLRLKDVLKFVGPDTLAHLPRVCNVRLNFWPGEAYADLGASFEAETKHSHPREFCSFIVSGGYEHHIYLPTEQASSSYDVVKVTVSAESKSFALQDKKMNLSIPIKEKVLMSKDSFAYFNRELIHEVIGRIKEDSVEQDKGTLSINMVFHPFANESLDYNLFLSDYSHDKIVEDYEKIEPHQAEQALIVVRKILQQRIQDLKDLHNQEKADAGMSSHPTLRSI